MFSALFILRPQHSDRTFNEVPSSTPEALVAPFPDTRQKRSPFFQTRSRALLTLYFTRELADLIWKDAVTSKGEVGALDGDPLYDAQDFEIKKFLIH